MTYLSKTLYIDKGGIYFATANVSIRVQIVRKRGRYHYRPDSKPLTSPRC